MKLNPIYRILRRALLLVAAVATTTISSAAAVTTTLQTKYEVDAGHPAGSADNPYLISSKADLMELRSNQALWGSLTAPTTANGLPTGSVVRNNYYYFEQTADIDMEMETLGGMIGYGTNNTNTTYAYAAIHKPFVGSYDGKGYSIKNLLIDWSVINANNIGFAMFGFTADADIFNLVLDHPVLARQNVANPSANNGYDVRTAFVAASAVNTRFNNIQIIDGVATTGKANSNGTVSGSTLSNMQSFYFGGIVGDITAGHLASVNQNTDVYGLLEIDNVYVDADLDFSGVNHYFSTDARRTQFNVGGIVGRYRRAPYEALPTRCFFSGSIKAPTGSVSPTWGMSRCNGVNNEVANFRAYAGEVLKVKNTAGSSSADAEIISLTDEIIYPYGSGVTVDVNANRYYYDYHVYDVNTNSYVAFDGTGVDAPSAKDATYGCRTLGGGLSGLGSGTSVVVDNTTFWRHLQGINHGTYIDLSTASGRNELLRMFRQGSNSDPKFVSWGIDEHNNILLGKAPSVRIVRTGGSTFKVEMENVSDQDFEYTLTATDLDGVDHTLFADRTEGITFNFSIDIPEIYSLLKLAAVSGDHSSELYTEYDIPMPLATINLTSVQDVEAAFATGFTDVPMHYYWRTTRNDGTTSEFTTGLSNALHLSEVNAYHYIEVAFGDANRRWSDYLTIFDMPNTSQYFRIIVETGDRGDGGVRYIASVYDNEGNLLMGGAPTPTSPRGYVAPGFEDYNFLWQVGSDPASVYAWEPTTGDTYGHSYIDPFDIGLERNRFYRATWGPATASGDNVLNYAQGIRGSKRVIFLYDKEKTDQGRSLYAMRSGVAQRDHNTGNPRKYFTTFDGINHWTDSEGIEREEPYPDGDDRNMGYDPSHAVKSMKRAYELIEPELGVDGNIIVVMGLYYDETCRFLSYELTDEYAKPATITGKYGARISDGAIGLINSAPIVEPSVTGNNDYPLNLRGATKFTEITWIGYQYPYVQNHLIPKELLIYCNRNDLFIDDNVYVLGYKELSNERLGLIPGTKAPVITIVGGVHNNAKKTIPKPLYNIEDEWTTIDVQSGVIMRLIAGSRNNAGTSYVFGSPEDPHRVKIKVSVTHGSNLHEYSPCDVYTYDIGLITGGQTDGSIYAEVDATVVSGSIGRYAAGNISYGRKLSSIPDDSFFGSTKLNLIGGSISELYGGSLGRFDTSGEETCNAYFYGQSEIIVDGATIRSVIYGAGAGGVAGTGTCRDHFWHHTNDRFIPYRTVTNDQITEDMATVPDVLYGSFDDIAALCPVDANGVSLDGKYVADYLPLFRLAEKDDQGHHKTLSLARAKSDLKIISGYIDGDIFGGSHGFSNEVADIKNANILAGNFYGDTKVTIGEPNSTKVLVITGNIYGGGAGSDGFHKQWLAAGNTPVEADQRTDEDDLNEFLMVARTFGNCDVTINSGEIMGDVYGGAKGVAGRKNIASVFGNTSLTINDGTIMGNVFGGCDVAVIDHRDNDPHHINSGSSSLTVNGGVLGNNLFGGSRGTEDTESWIQGNTSVTVLGGQFYPNPFINLENGDDGYRTFNVYGGGYINCQVDGDATVYMEKSLLVDEASIFNPTEAHNPDRFAAAFHDILFRRFCVYGGGYGENTEVSGNTLVNLNIMGKESNSFVPSDGDKGYVFHPGQTFFDVSGGGYSGNVGYWVRYKRDAGGNIELDSENKPIIDCRTYDIPVADSTPADFDAYLNGKNTLFIQGWPFIRKLVGGGFYASSNETETHLISGSVRTVIGGALLGYVHKTADLYVGTVPYDWLTIMEKPEGATDWSDEQKAEAERLSKESNANLYVVEAIYGGNDVKGIVGTARWHSDTEGLDEEARELADNGPLFVADVTPDESKGVTMFINGGHIQGDVYGAGNGNYRGYYVPGWLRYEDGPARHYRNVLLPTSYDTAGNLVEKKYGRVYRSRPMTGSVCIHLAGREDDPVVIEGNLYGGGRSCTIGQWNTILPFEDPRRLTRGGYLHLNFGSNVTVKGNVYLGVEGDRFTNQSTMPTLEDGITPVVTDLRNFDGSSTSKLDVLGELAYDHWWLDPEMGAYVPGFPANGKVDGNFRMTGEHMFRAYLKNIEMNGDVEVTFYSDPYYRDANGKIETATNDEGLTYRRRKHWVPAEYASTEYDATNITFNSFYMGGASGSMTNNTEMLFDYTIGSPISRADAAKPENASHKIERYGAIYRLTLPQNVTIQNKLVGGSADARTVFYPYSPDLTRIVTTKEEPDGEGGTREVDAAEYVFEGGIVTQSLLTYDLIVYWDKQMALNPNARPTLDVPSSAYLDASNPDVYTLTSGPNAGKTIYRMNYNPVVDFANGLNLGHKRYSIAAFDAANTIGYSGRREERRGTTTAIKIGCGAQFAPQIDTDRAPHHVMGEGALDAPESMPVDYFYRYGGIIYGGCFNSGITMGDVIINVVSDLIGERVTLEEANNFNEISKLKYNIGRVFGGGYGEHSRVDGDTYVNLLSGVKAMNVFGGGCRGDVAGKATINYVGTEDNSVVFGAIYGGGLYGSVGANNITTEATEINLYSGNVDKVYGGSCLGNLYGRSHINIVDEVTTSLPHLDYSVLVDYNTSHEHWGGSRLIVGSVYGGNDISGNIYLPNLDLNTLTPAQQETLATTGMYPDNYYTTTVNVYEVPSKIENDNNATPAPTRKAPEGEGSEVVPEPERAPLSGPGKDTPGAVEGKDGKYYSGFPLVGNIYGGSNGNYGLKGDSERTHYTGGSVELAVGADDASVMTLHLNGDDKYGYEAFEVPHIDRARINMRGGTVINAFGGGENSTIAESTDIFVNYNEDNLEARAGFWDEDELIRIWNVLHLESDEQRNEIVGKTQVERNGAMTDAWILKYQIYRLFGGNDNASMSIQPTWHLTRGYTGSVYSGGNFGTMTHYRRDADDKPVGLSLRVDSPDFHADAVYGGGRVGDVIPNIPNEDLALIDKDFYGATVEIDRGVIDHVYGGNDVAGNVSHGSRVVIRGAISGDVYCAGNGNYRYIYDDSDVPVDHIVERYNEEYGGRYFQLPPKEEYGGSNPNFAQKILAINSYRPNVERAYLWIEGSPEQMAYVRGNVYCGGNSSTVHPMPDPDHATEVISDIRFKIGSNVTLNGVYLGSNGENLAEGDNLRAMIALNGVDLKAANDLTEEQAAALAANPATAYDAIAGDLTLYPHLLDIYMRAVDVEALPTEFSLDNDITNAYIGDFFLGGNRGSMLTDKTITLTFPESIVFFGKIVGGSNDANLTFDGITHTGGLTRPLAGDHTEKIHMVVKSRFEPWKLVYPLDGDVRKIKRAADLERSTDNKRFYFPESKCNIYGGCFTSGRTVGNIFIDLYSDLTADYTADSEIGKALSAVEGWNTYDSDNNLTGSCSKKRVIVDGVNYESRRSFAVVGGGYGSRTSVLGDISIRMLPGKVHPTYTEGLSNLHPSTAAIFGGSQLGEVIGNTTIKVRDGEVLTNLYGASESAKLYGSTQIIVGWPKYAICNEKGKFTLNRTDAISDASIAGWTASDGRPAVVKHVSYLEDELCSTSIYDLLSDADKAKFTLIEDDVPNRFSHYHSIHGDTYNNITWDDIEISIGSRASLNDPDAEYFGHGNIYGGGFVSASSTVSLAGQYTVCRYDKDNNPDGSKTSPLIGYGGNSMILISDNPENADLSKPISAANAEAGTGAGADGALIRDHVSVGTGRYVPVEVGLGRDIMGKYVLEGGRYIHQSSYILGSAVDEDTGLPLGKNDPMAQKTYYQIESDGGIYGGGRKVYTEGFRDCNIAYYGYAGSTPQFPKLLNTIQRLDLLTVTDCCLHLEGANDFATNTIDATHYSMTRIGEIKMVSSIEEQLASLPDTNAKNRLNPGLRETKGLYNVLHDAPRIRNYMAFFHDVHYVAALTSSTTLDDKYRGPDGRFYSLGDYGTDPAAPNPGEVKPAYMTGADYVDMTGSFSYSQYKKNRIENYYANRGLDDTGDNQNIRAYTRRMFDRRNVGTAANMIGINNGFTLKVQGAVAQSDNTDRSYYGPATGVFEVKLLTLAPNEGGGYIFALNQHDDPNHFMQTTGNFVFPGAAYMVSDEETSEYNYINDDCFPMGKGWDNYYKWDGSSSAMGPRTSPTPAPGIGTNGAPRYERLHQSPKELDEGDHLNCNDEQDIHYWYVNGTNYYYNVTLTAYTYNEASEFSLDNIDQLIYLYGVNPGDNLSDPTHTDLFVKSVTWTKSLNGEEGADSDIQNLGKDYRLYLSIDDNPNYFHDLNASSEYHNHSFVSTVTRSDYDSSAAEGSRTTDDAADPSKMVDGQLVNVINNFTNYTAAGKTVENMPMLGISLADNVDNATKAYYDKHLKEPEMVRIELQTKDATPFTYIINLTIKYLLGPTITGNPVIENCALPGEYIYANSFGVDIQLDDENMAVTGRNWYIVPGDTKLDEPEDFKKAVEGINTYDPLKRGVGKRLDDEKFSSDRQVHIPAYLYLDGWKVIYEIIANNMPFYRSPAPVATVDAPQGHPYDTQLVVHNYHRFRPYDGSSILLNDDHTPVRVDGKTLPSYEDLHVTAGADLYIEDDGDMTYFYQLLHQAQKPSNRYTENGLTINPQYGDSLNVYLMNDVKMPELPVSYYDVEKAKMVTLTAADVANLRFRATFHGNGHNIDMGENEIFVGINEGLFYNTGFISRLENADATVIDNNLLRTDDDSNVIGGKIENCFLFNAKNIAKGYLVNPANRNGVVVNCFRTSDNAEKENVAGLIVASKDEFDYGETAYDLNRFYLQKRFNLGSGNPDGDLVAPLKKIYNDGNYRFARWSTDGNSKALRTYSVPNYHDYLGKRINVTIINYGPVTGVNATHHNVEDLIDESRARYEQVSYTVVDPDTNEETTQTKSVFKNYEPNYPDDYIFFGQDLRYDSEEEPYPHTINETNRVYRASGFYGSKVDYGTHFNVDAQADYPLMTAIDFTGIRDKEIAAGMGNDPSRYFVSGSAVFRDAGGNMVQRTYYPPILDLPEGGPASFATRTQLLVNDNREVPEEHVSRNLIVYAPESAATTYAAGLIYDESTEDTDIYAHYIPVKTGADGRAILSEKPTATLLHLVDREDYNAPIAFDVTDKTWYARMPETYSSGNNGWEGLYLPFTVKKVYSEVTGGGNPARNHGELSHFYGDGHTIAKQKGLEEADSHEYWLRKFTAVERKEDRFGVERTNMIFERPACDGDLASNPEAQEEKHDYDYSNTYFKDVFSDYNYNNDTDKRDQYNGTGVTYTDYPMITSYFPYLTAYPGVNFREFDLSGEFYSKINTATSPLPQRINYIREGLTEIGVTDDADLPDFTHELNSKGYTLRGTFRHKAVDATMALINTDDNHASFKRNASERKVDPFRVYLQLPATTAEPMPIATRTIDLPAAPDDEEVDDPETMPDEYYGLEVYVEDNRLLIVSPYDYDLNLPMYDVAGRLMRMLHVTKGDNYFDNISSGIYIVAATKVHIF